MLKLTKSLPFVLLATTIAFAGFEKRAQALQGGEDPALLPVLLDKRFGPGGRHQLGLTFSTSMATKFIEGTGAHLTYVYNFTDMFGLEIGAGGFLGRESSIMEQVRLNFGSGSEEPPLSDLHQMVWVGTASFMFVPIYGKMSFASEFDPSFDLYFLAGVGAAGLRRQIGLMNPEYDNKVGVAFNFGLGFRFYITKLVALRFEFRDYFYPDPGPPADIAPVGAETGGMTFNLHLQAGLQFAFGGAE
jgi:outer membrane beta-barrel protein